MLPNELAQALREGGQVQRMHCTPHLQPYSVAQHCWGMAMLLRTLYPGASQALLWAVLTHDNTERWLGDIPAPAKWDIAPDIKPPLHVAERRIEVQLGIALNITKEEDNWLHALDLAELWLYSREEMAMGNTLVKQMEDTCYRLLLERDETPLSVKAWAIDHRENGQRSNDFFGMAK